MLSLANVRFQYPEGGFSLEVPEMHIAAGETLAIIGPSGSGKTTLLNLMAGILRPDRGTIAFRGEELATHEDAALRRMRLSDFGLVFQEFELLDYLNVLENILLPLRLSRDKKVNADATQLATRLLEGFSLSDKKYCSPSQLSQGERQRVALCRAVIMRPALLLADEPTGNLDPGNKDKAMDFLIDYVQQASAALVAVTHDHRLVQRFDRVIDFEQLLPSVTQA